MPSSLRRCVASLALLIASGLLAAPVHAQWVLIEDFESLTPGALAGQRDWSPAADPTFQVGTDPSDAANQVMRVDTNASAQVVDAYNDDPNLTVGEGTTATLFFRVRLASTSPHVNLGLSDVAAPGGDFSDFEVQLRNQDTALDARDGASFENLGVVVQDEWYSVWIVVDNAADTWRTWVRSPTQFPVMTELTSGPDAIDFRNGSAAGDLLTFFVRSCPPGTPCGSSPHDGPWYLDDLYLDQGQSNLSDPISGQGPTGFVEVDDFESHAPGDVAGQGSWSAGADTLFEVAADPLDPANQALCALGNATGAVVDAYNDDPALEIAEGTTGTLFFRLYVGGAAPHVNFGMSDVAAPGGDFAHFETQLRTLSGALDARDGGAFELLDSPSPGEWLLVWMVANNASDSWAIWVQSASQYPTPTQLTSGADAIDFRNGTAGPLASFFLRSSDAHQGPWCLDDLHLDAGGANLANPVGPPPPPMDLTLDIEDFAAAPTSAGSPPLARINVLREVPDGSGRLFVNDLRGPLYVIDGGSLQEYMDLDDAFPDLKTSPGLASGFVSFAFDPEFATNGLFYTVHSEEVGATPPDFGPALPLSISQHSVLTEWTAAAPSADTFSGTSREVLRIAAPHHFHNMGEIAFNPTAGPGDADYRLLYVGAGDYGTIQRNAPDQLQRLDTLYGAILRIDPRAAGPDAYSIPAGNPFVDGDPDTFDEIYAYGFRNAHRLAWDPDTGDLYVMDVGQDNAEEIDRIVPGGNYGWPFREGNERVDPYTNPNVSFPLTAQDLADDATFGYRYPVTGYTHGLGDAIAGGYPIRNPAYPALDGRFLFGDIVSGAVWSADLDEMASADDGDPFTLAPIVAHSLEEAGTPTTLLELVRDAAGDAGIGRTDLRFALDADGQIFVTTKQDGVIRTVPLPEPAGWAGLVAGAACLAGLQRRRASREPRGTA